MTVFEFFLGVLKCPISPVPKPGAQSTCKQKGWRDIRIRWLRTGDWGPGLSSSCPHELLRLQCSLTSSFKSYSAASGLAVLLLLLFTTVSAEERPALPLRWGASMRNCSSETCLLAEQMRFFFPLWASAGVWTGSLPGFLSPYWLHKPTVTPALCESELEALFSGYHQGMPFLNGSCGCE